MTIPSFEERVQQWSSPPVDDVGYIPSRELLAAKMGELDRIISDMAFRRYNGWRNYQNRWREVLGLDSTRGKRVLDYGCGVGLEALEYAKAGNDVTVCDISWDNVLLAKRVLRMNGFEASGFEVTQADLLHGFDFQRKYDVIHCVGVLHHIPEPIPVVKWMAGALVPGGELRLMVYSSAAWKIATGTSPPEGPVNEDPLFEKYWQRWDPHGGYADWYDGVKLRAWFGEWFTVERYEPLTEHGEYVGAVLVKR